jgi:hypothetical protein
VSLAFCKLTRKSQTTTPPASMIIWPRAGIWGLVTVSAITSPSLQAPSATFRPAARILATAWQVYGHIFRAELLPVPGLESIGPDELRMLREAATLMALNKVEDTGHISIIGAAWFFGAALPVVFDLSDEMGQVIDEAYHGTWFNESRRAESVLAHAALGGRLVHGCQSSPDMTGGVVAPYGAGIARFRDEINAMKHDMIGAIRAAA